MTARTVDRRIARAVAIKRIVTGIASLALGVALVVAVFAKGDPPALAAVAVALFWGGGAWTLRDGLRLRRELSRS